MSKSKNEKTGPNPRLTVSVIVPVFNEAGVLRRSLGRLLRSGADEILLVDGGSTDGGFERAAREFPSVRCLRASCANRGRQMNIGATGSSGEALLFVHADATLPDGAVDHVRRALASGCVGGGFTKRYAPASRLLNVYQGLLNGLYLRDGRGLVGSNAIFVHRTAFERIGGFPENGFLEDVQFVDRLHRCGRLGVSRVPVTVSSRRYLANGTLRQILLNARIMFGYRVLREKPAHLCRLYHEGRRRKCGSAHLVLLREEAC